MKSKKIYSVFVYLFLGIGAAFVLFPIVFLLLNSFKSQNEIVKTPLSLPDSLNFSYILNAINEVSLVRSLLLTALITIVSDVLIILISSSCAWMLVRFKSKVSTVLLLVFTSAMLIPFQAIMYPLVNEFDKAGLKNILGLILMYGGTGLAMSLLLYHGFIKSLPKDLEEAAIIDGANVFQVYAHVVMPLLRPTTAAVAIFNSTWIWNDYLMPFLVIGNGDLKTLTLSVYFAKMSGGQYGNRWDLVFPSVLISVIPIIIIFIILQKSIIRGMLMGSVKQ